MVAVLLEKMVEEDPPSEEPEQEEGALSPVKSTNMAHLQTQVFEMRAEITTISEQMKLVLKALGAAGSGVKQKRRPSAKSNHGMTVQDPPSLDGMNFGRIGHVFIDRFQNPK